MKNKKLLIIPLIVVTLILSTLLLINMNKKIEKNNSDTSKITEEKEEFILELKELTIKYGENYKIEDFVVTCNNCTLSYEKIEDSNITDIGEYEILIIAKNENNDEKKASTKLTIIEKEQNETQEQTDNTTADESNKPTEENNQSSNEPNKPAKENNQSSNNSNTAKKDSESNNSQSNQSSQQKENNSQQQSTPQVTKVDTTTETIKTDTYKYGTTITTTTTITYDIYSDGSKKEISKNTSTTYNYDTFNATTNELKSEASGLVNSNSSQINQVINYTNQYRSEVGAPDLTYDYNLSLAATIRALEMGWANKFSHTRPNGSSCFTIFSDLGIQYYIAAENIAGGYGSAKAVSEGWKNSSGHYSNMINPNHTKIGVGLAIVNGYYYWVQLFS